MIQISVGVSLHYDLKYSQLDFVIIRLTSTRLSMPEKIDIAEDVLIANDVDLGIWVRGFRKRFNTVHLLLSQESLAMLKLRERGKRLHTMRSERGHAGERHDLTTAASPGKAFHHHARRDLLSQVRVSHSNKGQTS